jgi:hypothetical protein
MSRVRRCLAALPKRVILRLELIKLKVAQRDQVTHPINDS